MNDIGKAVPNRLAAVTLGAWSAMLPHFYFNGRLHAFLAPGFRPYVLWAGLALAVMTLVLLFAGGELHACKDDSCGPLTRPGKQWTWMMLMIPVLIAAVAGNRDSFSATMVENRGTITAAAELNARPAAAARSRETALFPLPSRAGPDDGEDAAPPEPGDWLPRTPEGHIKLEVLDLIFAANEAAMRGDFEGRTVVLVGQFMPAPSRDAHPSRFKAVRLMMTCCAADARPAGTLVEMKPMPQIPKMNWVRITGTATFPIEGGKRVPVLRAEKIEPCPQPDETFVF